MSIISKLGNILPNSLQNGTCVSVILAYHMGFFLKCLAVISCNKMEFEIRALSFSNFLFSSTLIFGIKERRKWKIQLCFKRIESIYSVYNNRIIELYDVFGFFFDKGLFSVTYYVFYFFFIFCLSPFSFCWSY